MSPEPAGPARSAPTSAKSVTTDPARHSLGIWAGALLMLGSLAAVLISSALARELATRYPTGQILLFRLCGSLPLVTLFALLSSRMSGKTLPAGCRRSSSTSSTSPLPPGSSRLRTTVSNLGSALTVLIPNRLGLHVLRAVCGVAAALLTYQASRHLGFAEMVAIGYAMPLMVALLSWPILGEKVSPFQMALTGLGLFGVWIVVSRTTLTFPELASAIPDAPRTGLQVEQETTLRDLSPEIGLNQASFPDWIAALIDRAHMWSRTWTDAWSGVWVKNQATEGLSSDPAVWIEISREIWTGLWTAMQTVVWSGLPSGFWPIHLTSWSAAAWNVWGFAMIGAALLGAICALSSRLLSRTESSGSIAVSFVVLAIILSAPLALVSWTPLNPTDGLLFAGLGCSAGLAVALNVSALRAAPAAILAPIDYFGVLISALLGFGAWGEIPGFSTVVGGFLIVVCGVIHLSSAARQAGR